MTNAEVRTALRRWMEAVTTRSMRDWARYVKSTGLSMPQFRLLMELYYRNSCGVSQISDEMSITHAAASQLVDKLVQSGLLERTEDPNDRRVRNVALSEVGRTFVKNGIEQRYLWINDLAENLNGEERRTIARALTALTEKALSLQESERSEAGRK